METLTQLIDIALRLDVHLAQWTALYGPWIYLILFIVVFCETGLVVMPFLPGDSLLFVAGALCASGGMEITTLIAVLLCAAVLGDNVNYAIGRWVGVRVLRWGEGAPRFFNRQAFAATQNFYARWGPLTMVLARFIPLVRTFAPFVAGVARMAYPRYFAYDLLGAVLWVCSLSLAGYWFGNLPWVRQNLTLVILGIILLSLSPLLLAAVRRRSR